MVEWFSMGGRAAYVWSAYGITATVLIVNWLWLRHQTNAAILKTKRLAKPTSDDTKNIQQTMTSKP